MKGWTWKRSSAPPTAPSSTTPDRSSTTISTSPSSAPRALGYGNKAYNDALKGQIERQFGSFETFKTEFAAKGAGLFGSGWVWLSADEDGRLVITQEPNAGNPVTKGLRPLLTFDVWEHAYYLDYQNRRPDHLKALWTIIDWDEVERRYAE